MRSGSSLRSPPLKPRAQAVRCLEFSFDVEETFAMLAAHALATLNRGR